MSSKFKIRFSFTSLISIGALIGFCAGIVSIPIYILNLISASPAGYEFILVIVAAPIVGVINGALLGLLAYPLYWWLSKKIGFSYKGQLYEIN